MAAFTPSLPVVFGLFLVRAFLNQMDVPTRSSYVMAVVTEPERPAAASFTAVPRGLATAGGRGQDVTLFGQELAIPIARSA